MLTQQNQDNTVTYLFAERLKTKVSVGDAHRGKNPNVIETENIG